MRTQTFDTDAVPAQLCSCIWPLSSSRHPSPCIISCRRTTHGFAITLFNNNMSVLFWSTPAKRRRLRRFDGNKAAYPIDAYDKLFLVIDCSRCLETVRDWWHLSPAVVHSATLRNWPSAVRTQGLYIITLLQQCRPKVKKVTWFAFYFVNPSLAPGFFSSFSSPMHLCYYLYMCK